MGKWAGQGRDGTRRVFGELCSRRSPRLCGWLCEVSFRATSPAAAGCCGSGSRVRGGGDALSAATARACAGGCARSASGPPRQRRRFCCDGESRVCGGGNALWTPSQPARARVAARGQPSGHLASGGVVFVCEAKGSVWKGGGCWDAATARACAGGCARSALGPLRQRRCRAWKRRGGSGDGAGVLGRVWIEGRGGAWSA